MGSILCQLITDSYSKLFWATLENYQRGCAKPIQITPEISGDLFSRKMQPVTESLPRTDKLLMNKFNNARERGLIATRRGDLVTAERAFSAARVLLELDKLSLSGSLLYQSFLEQAESYLDYCRSDFEQARNRIYAALAVDEILEEEYKYNILLIHRIQLIHNLVRVDARCMNFEGAIELACQILSYLEAKLEVLPIPGNWGYERVLRQPAELVGAMFAQVTGEVALILAGKNRQVVGNLFAVVSNNLQLQMNGNCQCHLRANAWFFIKKAFVSNDVVLFLERVSQFLSEGRADTPLLWYATVIDLIVLCKELDLPDSELFMQQVARDAATWEHLPQKFSSLLGVHPKAEAA
ncbi:MULTISPECIES: hypothetical protein [Nostoc]|uniref:Uncharacterized protein n=1 Tax=Nostoc paludosum FACHB-159 TaxID=2692908 RepID=A0ABR8KIK6_9NOSO|nr:MULTISPECIES: hypothetical protein [Nostoc]MBD2679335.1 hypothetical protein [Nostoc sp. FACHB-857]MBD2738564.1 hypothetical protein [Nostoc paludosum FACHB-159]